MRMIVWGGSAGPSLVDTGGRYDPAADLWTPTSTAGAPSGRRNHTAIWTGAFMVVWGGGGAQSIGGRYALGQSVDGDGDGLSTCDGDCSDEDPTVFGTPPGIENLRWLSPSLLAWDSAAATSGAGTTYDVMYGDLGDVSNLRTGAGDRCLGRGLTDVSLVDTSPMPLAGQGLFLLVRGSNVCGAGRYETATDGSDRETTACQASTAPETCDCCVPNYSVGCEDPACEAATCNLLDPYCCEVAWDLYCDSEANRVCVPPCGDCCDALPNSGLGCNDDFCEAIVCLEDEYCCLGWHAGCAELASRLCTCCGSTGR
jgi:hypothetical protein